VSKHDEAPKLPIPQAGDAARKARNEGDNINRAYGVPIAPRGEFAARRTIWLRGVGGIRWEVPIEPAPDLSARVASDYLPPRLKRQLISEGRLKADGTLIALPPAAARSGGSASPGKQAAAARGVLARLGRLLRKLF